MQAFPRLSAINFFSLDFFVRFFKVFVGPIAELVAGIQFEIY